MSTANSGKVAPVTVGSRDTALFRDAHVAVLASSSARERLIFLE